MKSEIEEITNIRSRNNDLWMAILDIALQHAPEETKALLTQILENDIAVTEQVKEILNEDADGD